MSQALYRKYHSRTLDEVLGQDHVTSVLGHALEKGKIAHAYLLTGPRGTGKTSVARILAHEVISCPMTETTRILISLKLTRLVTTASTISGAYARRRVLHQHPRSIKSTSLTRCICSQNQHLMRCLKLSRNRQHMLFFILATTDADKLPDTILSRVQQYYFRPISTNIITKHLMDIAKKEGFAIEESARSVNRRTVTRWFSG